ncbi:hypothetical protein BV25DRAFT_1837826 [Artomyces pyxidatus]|uniref:Uncharacterized protein n=1 Tax=Artomyces pyxidatus TaxID=48021 RepID=A0ACB8T3N0_9AGAM|nr:hypothetical protein BV25DRAFT_1837826 [Artomyces pyxidatus]
MDSPSSNTPNPSVPRQRVSPSNDSSAAPSPVSVPQGQAYPYPVQQQQTGWNAQAQPFYPSFYQNPHQQPYPIHPQQAQIPPQNPYFDPNAQFAQWAYHQMMFNAQQQAHQLAHTPQPPQSMSQRGRSPSAPSGAEYFAQNQLQGYSPFPSGTPPPHPSQNGYRGSPAAQQQQQQQQYDGFHPYRRPNHRQGSHSADQPSAPNDWRPPAQFQPPYARNDAAGSTTSVNSTGSGSRQRTSSLQGSSGGGAHHHPSNASANGSVRGRGGPAPTAHSPGGSVRGGAPPIAPAASSQGSIRPHHRNGSSSSSSSSLPPARAPATVSTTPSLPHTPIPRPARPSPLSQGSMSAADKRKSRDDSELMEPIPTQNMVRSGGLKGRLRRALSLSAAQAISEENAEAAQAAEGGPADTGPPTASGLPSGSSGSALQSNAADAGDAASTTTKQTKKKSRTALFNSRLNASTDNISLSSTMSSASVVIRKLGSIGKLARRNSLAGITSLFKDKEKKEKDEAGTDGGGKKDKKKKKGEKGEAAEASISHVTAELDRVSGSSEWTAELNGLSPAAKLARQHTLKSNAEAAAAAKARAVARQEEEAAAAAAQEPVPTTWEKNTTTRSGDPGRSTGGTYRVNEEGMRVIVEDDDSASEGEGAHDYSHHLDGWEEDDWSHVDDDEDVTIRQGLERTSLGEEDGDDHEPWAVGVRRSEERTRQPAKGILKNADNYDQHIFLDSPAGLNRGRANSYNSPAAQARELGPLAHLPAPDPDHIDGVRHPSHSATSSMSSNGSSSGPSFLPPFSFDSPGDLADADDLPRPTPEKTLFNHPNLNSSAPVLSAMLPSPPSLAHRSATTPANSKRLAFASNLSVYDTFPATVYDRRSEPATWSRLTPALAQRIKEELNSYKMEEMEVHASSRIHTQFFV